MIYLCCVFFVCVVHTVWGLLPSGRIFAIDIDFNWNVRGPIKSPNGYAPAGLWHNTRPETHMDWYASMGVNVIQSFAVSCDGYSWYKGSHPAPPQPGLQSDFLPQLVRLGHERNISVMGYFNFASNTRWGEENPSLSYGNPPPSAYHIPFTDQYISYLEAQIRDALVKTQMDGYMIDWFWPVSQAVRDQYNQGDFIPAEADLYQELMGKPFPGVKNVSTAELLRYERAAVARVWDRVYRVTKATNPSAVIWLSSNNIDSPLFVGSKTYQQVDYAMDESGRPDHLRSVLRYFGSATRPILCLSWASAHASSILSNKSNDLFGLYGFTSPANQTVSIPMCANDYLRAPLSAFPGVAGNVAALTRYYKGLPFTYVNASLPDKCAFV